MSRKMIDCRDYPSDKKCSILISGEEEEVVKAAVDHAVSFHGMQNTDEVRDQIRNSLKDEPAEWFANKNKIRMDKEPRTTYAS